MIESMYKLMPNIIFIDSVNEIDEFMSGNKKEARRLINGLVDESGNEIKPGLRKVCQDLGCHIIILGQKNQDGTIKGGTSFPHLVDVEVFIHKESKKFFVPDKHFIVEMGKNRYGDSDRATYWKHEDDGVILASDNRLGEKKYCEIMGLIRDEDNSLYTLEEYQRYRDDRYMKLVGKLKKIERGESVKEDSKEGTKGLIRGLIKFLT